MKRSVPFLFLTIAMLWSGLLCNAQTSTTRNRDGGLTSVYYDFEDGQIPNGVTLQRASNTGDFGDITAYYAHRISVIASASASEQVLNRYDPSDVREKSNSDGDVTGYIASPDLNYPRNGNVLNFRPLNDAADSDSYTYVRSDMILPVFDFSDVTTSVTIDFWYARQKYPAQASTSYDKIYVYYSTNGTSWTQIGSAVDRYLANPTWEHERFTTNALNGLSTAYIKLRFSCGKDLSSEGTGTSNTEDFYERQLFIDDLKVYPTQAVTAPTTFVVLDTAEDAVLATWTRTASESAWEVLYVPQGTDVEDLDDYVSTNIISVNSDHATIASNVVTVGFPFPESGSWDLYVRAVSGASHSEWSLRQEITTKDGSAQSMLYNEFNDSETGGETIIGSQVVDFESGALSTYNFSNTASSHPWIIWSDNPNDGTYCMASNNYNIHSSESYIDATVNFAVDGYIEFYSRVSSESASFDYGVFYIDNEEKFREGGTSPNTWTYRYYEVTAGSHTFRWYYRKDNSVNKGEDRFFIDNITFYGTSETTIGGIGEYTAMRVDPYYLRDPHGETYDWLTWTLDDHGLNANASPEFQGRSDVLEYYPDNEAGSGRYSTPLLDFTDLSSSDAVAVSFLWFYRHYHTNANDVVKLQYSLDGSTWTDIGNALQTYNADPHWEEKAFETTALSGKYGYFGLYFTKVQDNGYTEDGDFSYAVEHHMYLDDWLIRPKQAMAAPLNLTAAAITDSTATLGWNAVTGATSYTLLQVPTGTTYAELDSYLADNPSAATTVTGTCVTIRGLEENADFFVRANGANGSSSWSMRVPVTLIEGVTLADALIYTFIDDPADLSAWTTKVMAGYTEKGLLSGNDDGRVDLYASLEDLGFSFGDFTFENGEESEEASCMSYFLSSAETDATAPKARVVLAPIDLTNANSAQIDFDWYHTSTPNNAADKIDILYSMDAGLTWTAIRSGLTRYKASTNAWTHYTNAVAAMNGGVALIAIDFYMKASANAETEVDRMYIDNIQVTPIYDCELPVNLTATYVSGDAATLTWTAGTATNWTAVCFDIESVPALSEFDAFVEENLEDNGMAQNVSTNMVTFTGLTGETTYYVFVRANCDQDTHSAWSPLCSFTTTNTSCESLEPEFEEVIHQDDFENFSETYTSADEFAKADLQDACYTIEHVGGTDNNGGFFVTATALAGNTTNQLEYYPKKKNTSDRIILPAFNLRDGAACVEVNFDYYQVTGNASTTKGYVKLQYCLDGTNWIDVAQVNRIPGGLSANGWNHFSYFIENVAGTYCRFAFLVHSGTTGASSGDNGYASYLDNIVVNYTPIYIYITSDQTEQNYNIASYQYVRVFNDATLSVSGTLTNNGTTDNLVISDGSQLVTSHVVNGTMLKNITGTSFGTAESPTYGGYYLIATPVADINPLTVAHMIVSGNNGDYDLYGWDATDNLEWRNYKASHFNLEQGYGYLYANTNTDSLEFAGALNANFTGVDDLFYDADYDLHCLNLVGNPFAYRRNFSVYDGNTAVSSLNYLTMNAAGDGFIVHAITNGSFALNPMEAALIQATDSDESFDLASSKSRGDDETAGNGTVNIGVTADNGTLIDNAIVRFGEGNMMRKLYLSESSTRIYIPSGSNQMAIVSGSDNGVMPVNFEAIADGTYTLNIEASNMQLRYLHLVDNLKGVDVDLLQTPTYTFEANADDAANRFKLVFSTNAFDDHNAEANFAFYNGSAWVIANDGEATLQVVDVMGRVLSSEQINGDAEVNVNQAAGLYMLRLISGDSVRVQKVVVE